MHFKNRFRVDIRLSGTCFHLNIKIQAAFFRVETIGAANKAAAEDPYFAEDDVFEVFTEAYTYAGIRSKVLGYSDVEGLALIPQLQKYVAGEISAEEALANAQSQGDSILAEAAQQ